MPVIILLSALFFSGCFNSGSSYNKNFRDDNFWPRKTPSVQGQDFIGKIRDLDPPQREKEIFEQVVNGNVPSFLKQFEKVHLSAKLNNGKIAKGIIYVTPDYVSVGTDQDYVRVPMTPATAKKIADSLHCLLPTAKIVDEIYRQAETKLSPQPMTPGPEMTSVPYFAEHNRMINAQLKKVNGGGLIAGHKKDIVISSRLREKPGRVAIYGWHRKNGEPIQPLSTVHGSKYVDYSHGVRLIWSYMKVNGQMRKVSDVLADTLYSSLISYEGPIEKAADLLIE